MMFKNHIRISNTYIIMLVERTYGVTHISISISPVSSKFYFLLLLIYNLELVSDLDLISKTEI